MRRVNIYTGAPFSEFRAAFEKAVPIFDPAPMQQIAGSSGSWGDVRTVTAVNASNQLMIYETIDLTPLLAMAGYQRAAVEYLSVTM